MEATDFDELAFFAAISGRGVRALLIGRRALALLGLPLHTADYDFWLHGEDIEAFNALARPFGLSPTRTPAEARARGHYALENDEHVDLWVARAGQAPDGTLVEFEGVWQRRRHLPLAEGVQVAIPAIDDLIATKRLGGRPKDLEDVRLLEILREAEEAAG